MRPDPKKTIVELWKNGGFLDPTGGFNPHFIAREGAIYTIPTIHTIPH